ncbi:bifunctional diguanylate cyclase/phosphodiesterase [Acinetobacter boissieri]|uniref:Diguanylate cyclase/phosphodiesterase with PAS/PAC sensor(S) n=1 Tax=Acinetobacter boissieri TaxID=1219383 RepID=A0A1G6HG91_9GAMM|nr:bifunctional diguanylate cyclase/phosphodiesterase [Acinetobacter boissieri]SDB93269.1 diguanylate cyclase/phosphodiesterase with PAS/PAC sensor(s) [Acinetobacter boissieri]
MLFSTQELDASTLSSYKNSVATKHLQPFLLSVFFVCLFICINFNLSFPAYTKIINLFFVINNCLLLAFFILVQYYTKKSVHLDYLNYICNVICLLVGLSLACAVYLLHIYLPVHYPKISFSDTFYITIILVTTSLFSALCYLSFRLSCFFFVAIPMAFPTLLLQPVTQENIVGFLPLSFNFIFLSVYISAFVLNRNYNKHVTQILVSVQTLKQQQDKMIQRQKHTDKQKHYLSTIINQQKQLKKSFFHISQNINEQNELIHKQKILLQLAQNESYNHIWQWDIEKSAFYVDEDFFAFLRNDALIAEYTEGVIHPDDTEHFLAQLKKHFNHTHKIFECECRIRHQNVWTWFSGIGQVVKSDPITREPILMMGLFKNIEEEKQRQNQIQLSANIIENLNVGIITLDKNLHFINANPFFCQLSCLKETEIIGKHLFDLTDKYTPQQRSLHFSITEQLRNTGKYIGEFEEKFVSSKLLNIAYHIQAVTDQQHNVSHYIGIISDLTAQKKQEEHLSFLKNYDDITQLPNRFYYNFKLYELMLTERKNLSRLAVIHLSIDRFNALHEFLGNDAIHQLLKSVADRLNINNHDAFIVACINRGDFALIYELNQLHKSVEEICGRIIQDFNDAFTVSKQDLILTVSIGVSIYPDHALNAEQLNNYAHQTLLQAQRLGGNTVQYYSQYSTSYIQDVNLENELRYAIKNDGLEVFYQPKTQTDNKKVVGFEALIRWNHPTKGLIPPSQFLSYAKQTSMVSEIGQYVLETSAQQVKAWQDLGYKDISISINIDPQQLYRGQLLELLDEILAKHQIEGRSLEFELTESALIEKTDHIKSLLDSLKQRGVTLSLDDFGTGYSSLAYLTNFPFDAIKIDQHFVQNIADKTQIAVLNAIIAMGKAIGLTIIAEGVETQEQLEFLQQKKCDIIQGYIYARPLPAADATHYLKTHYRA